MLTTRIPSDLGAARRRARQSGMAYVAVLVLTILLGVMGLSFLLRSSTQNEAAQQRVPNTQAHYLAEAAAKHAAWRVLNEADFPAETNVYYMHNLEGGRYGYKVVKLPTAEAPSTVSVSTVGVTHGNLVLHTEHYTSASAEMRGWDGWIPSGSEGDEAWSILSRGAVADNWIDGAHKNNNHGADESLNLESNSKLLLRFNLDVLPDGVEISSASLQLYALASGSHGNTSIRLYAVAPGNTGWIEGEQLDSEAMDGESCWNDRAYSAIEWTGGAGLGSPGEGYGSTLLDSIPGQFPLGQIRGWNIASSVVQGWIDYPTSNSGLLIETDTGGSFSFGSREQSHFARRPHLKIEYYSPGLDAHYELDDASGLTARDSSSHRNHGTLINMAGDEWTTGPLDGALAFNGTDDCIDLVPSNALLVGDTSFTLMAWFQTSTLSTTADRSVGKRLVTLQRNNEGEAAASRVSLGFYGDGTDKLAVSYSNGTGSQLTYTGGKYADGYWHHYACTYNSETNDLILYFDGDVATSASVGTIVAGGSGKAKIGALGSDSGLFNGLIDDVWIYSDALSPEEIRRIYDSVDVEKPSALGRLAGIAVADYIEVKNSGRIDGGADHAAVVSLNSTQNDTLKVGNDGVIDGDVYIGPDGDPDSVIQIDNNGRITGSRGVLEKEIEIPTLKDITVPDLGASKGNVKYPKPSAASRVDLQRDELKGDLHCNTLTIEDNAIVEIQGNVRIVADGKIQIGGKAQVNLLDGASLTIYSKDAFVLEGNATVNANTKEAARFVLYHLSTLDCVIAGDCVAYCTALAPDAVLKIQKGPKFYGTFGGKELIVDNGLFHITGEFGEDPVDEPGGDPGDEPGEEPGEEPSNANLALDDLIKLTTAAKIDTYRSSLGPWGPANQSSNVVASVNAVGNGCIALSSSSEIRGDALIGPAGNPETGIQTWAGSTISGARGTLEAEIPMPQIEAPAGAPFDAPAESGISLWGTQSQTLSTNRHLQQIVANGSAIVSVTAPVTLLVEGNVEIGNAAALRIEENASLRLYVKGNVNVYGDFNVNTAQPGRVRVYMLGNNKTLQVSSGGEVHALVQNPQGNLNVWSSSFFGSFIGQKLECNGGWVHVDLDAGAEPGGGGGDDDEEERQVDTWAQAAAGDNWIRGDKKTRNHGDDDSLDLKSNTKLLVRFDLSGLPGGVELVSAKLKLYALESANHGNTDLKLYAVAAGNAGWIEGEKKDGTATTGESCWNKRVYDSTNWAGGAGLGGPGDGYGATPLDSIPGDYPLGQVCEWDIDVAVIQGWLADPGSNAGLLLETDTGGPFTFGSREQSDSAKRPQLEIEYR